MPTMPTRRGSGYGMGGGGGGGGEVIAGRYRVLEEAGRGNFAKVVKARDMKTDEVVAVKVLEARYARDAKFELEVLEGIVRKDTRDHFKVCKLRSYFKLPDGSNCFVFTLLGPSLKQRKISVRDPTSRRTFKNLVKQLGRALQYLHFECRLIHTDLKPENILLDDPNEKGMGNGWTIVDFGSASFYTERPDRDLISTRPYRAPEVLVGGAWSYAADMWSFGCILYELYTGRMLFDCANDAQHLQTVERRIGKAPSWLADHADPNTRHQLFDSSNRLRPSIGMGHPHPLTDDIPDDPNFTDLLKRLLHYDPVLRIRADEVIHHPFVKNADPVKGETPPLTKLPPSAYSSGRIRCPGASNMTGPRARLDVPVERDERGVGSRSGSGEEPRVLARRGSGSGGEAGYRPVDLERQLARLGIPSRHLAPPPPSRAVYAAEDSLRAIAAADAALYPRSHAYNLPMHHQRRY